ncbi:GTPase activating protein (SH3 domain) binding protein [Phytophthora boehmeriae]|uniref:GTPase activating protein (SH3 domain) binding protein n=1 Tax=Phytophthora boehmeriae TaxID=109152 RepID=A0A8T1X4K6_9STRA|nr:GTPase activating protein (SH3 domain) binding protein [Phytophthora boehmeriae]
MPETSSREDQEAPAPSTVGNTFMRQYYHFLAKEPQSLHRFYKSESRWCHGVGSHMEEPIAGQRAINDQILKRGYAGARVDLDAGSIDCQNSLGGGVLVLVTGVMTLRASPEPKPFVQTFFLAVQPKGYFVLNDCLRFLELPAPDSDKDVAAVAAVSATSNGKEAPASPKKTEKKDVPSPVKTDTKTETKTLKKVVKDTPASPVKATATVASSPVKKTTITTTTTTTTSKPEKKEETVKPPASPVKQPSPVKSPVKTESPPKSPVKSPKKQDTPVAAAPAAKAEPVAAAPTEPEKPKTWAALFNSKAPTSAAPTSATTTTPPVKPATPKAAPTPAPAPAAITPAAGTPTTEKSPKNKSGNGKEKESSRPRLYSLFIRDVPSQTRENDLRELFKSYGSIAGVNVNQRGYAFVDYHEEKSMRAALAETTEFRLFDKVLQVGERGERKEGQRGSFRGNDSRGRGRGHGPKSGRGERKERNGEDASTNKGDRREGPRREKTGNRRGGKTEGAPQSRAE